MERIIASHEDALKAIERNMVGLKNNEPDMVNHPNHYQSETGLEVIDVIEAFTFDLKGIDAVCTANAIKYLCRWSKKNGIQDLKKAAWYIDRLVKHLELIEKENKND